MIPRDLFVHVGGPGRECAPAIVLRPGHVSLVRILRPSPFGSDPGLSDEEGDVRNYRDARWVPNPQGVIPEGPDYDPPAPGYREPAWRLLDSWHYQHECLSPLAYPPVPDGYQLDATAEVVP